MSPKCKAASKSAVNQGWLFTLDPQCRPDRFAFHGIWICDISTALCRLLLRTNVEWQVQVHLPHVHCRYIQQNHWDLCYKRTVTTNSAPGISLPIWDPHKQASPSVHKYITTLLRNVWMMGVNYREWMRCTAFHLQSSESKQGEFLLC